MWGIVQGEAHWRLSSTVRAKSLSTTRSPIVPVARAEMQFVLYERYCLAPQAMLEGSHRREGPNAAAMAGCLDGAVANRAHTKIVRSWMSVVTNVCTSTGMSVVSRSIASLRTDRLVRCRIIV